MEKTIFCRVEEDGNPPTDNPFKLFVPDLIQMASVKFVLSLYSEAFSENGTDTVFSLTWHSLVRIVYQKLQSLLVPKTVAVKLSYLNERIADELCYLSIAPWLELTESLLWSEVIWTSRGSIDYVATLRKTYAEKRIDFCVDDDREEDDWLYMNDVVLHKHPFKSYWDGDDEERFGLLRKGLIDCPYFDNEITGGKNEHYCYVLSKISEKMLKRVLENYGGCLLMIFFDNLLYKDYYMQLLYLLELYDIKLDPKIDKDGKNGLLKQMNANIRSCQEFTTCSYRFEINEKKAFRDRIIRHQGWST